MAFEYEYNADSGAWTELAQLIGPGGAAFDLFGHAVSLSCNGTVAAISASGKQVVYIYAKTGSTAWTLQTSWSLSSSGVPLAVAISCDGQSVAVGLYQTNRAFVYVNMSGAWVQTATLLASDGNLDPASPQFGYGVALNANGSVVVVGANNKNVTGNANQGAVYVYSNANGSWYQLAQLVASDGAMDAFFGTTVAISSDARTILIGAYNQGAVGAAYVFQSLSGNGSWVQIARLGPSDGANGDAFGVSVALSLDGRVALVGANYHTRTLSGQGSAYMYVAVENGTWVQAAALVASTGAAAVGADFGLAVAVCANGSVAAVGAPSRSASGSPG
jgi:hypothetical protein